MPTHVALLRGINLGGRNKVAMADLRSVMSALGHTDVSTYIQSGNVVFTAAETPVRPADIERAIASELSVSPAVVVLTRDELAQIARDNPYPDEPNPRAVHAVFLTSEASADTADALADALKRVDGTGSRDTAQLIGSTIYLHTPDGFGRSKLAGLIVQSTRPEMTGTARNWATVTKLLAMLED
ncbi:MAG TPA: DUF1697 domain-containing protein [Jiangellaceae bacterium]|nr:DUF1697 domain-containing protein [Jiangellaceae bacterium]